MNIYEQLWVLVHSMLQRIGIYYCRSTALSLCISNALPSLAIQIHYLSLVLIRHVISDFNFSWWLTIDASDSYSMWPCASHTTVIDLTATRPIMTLQPTGLQVSARECDSHMYIVHTCMRNSNNGIQFSHEGDTESRKTNKDMDE